MAELSIEAPLGKWRPVPLSSTVFQNTQTDIIFSVLDFSRNPLNVTSYAAKAKAKKDDTGDTLFEKACSIQDGANGKILLELLPEDTTIAGYCVFELALYADGDASGSVTDRVQFEIAIVEALV